MPINQTFEEQFRERFENLEEAPPAFAWNKISQEIAADSPAKAKGKGKVPKFKWLMPGAMISVISIALLFLLKYNKAIENQKAAQKKEYALQAETAELKEPTIDIAPETPETVAKTKEKPAFKAYQTKPEVNTATAGSFAKKRYLPAAEKSESPEKLKTATVRKKLNAIQVVYVVTVDPKSASVEKISTAVPDSAATSGAAN